MDPMTMMMLGQAGGSLLGNIMGGSAASDQRGQAAALQQQAMDIIDKIPNLAGYDKEIIYQKLISGQPLTTQQEQAVSIGKSKVAQIQEDPALRDTQKQALELMRGVASSGLRPEDRQALNQVRQQVQSDAEAKRQQILQNMQSRGMGGSGAELAAQLAASQAGIQTQSQQGDATAAQASRNALQALAGMSSMAGDLKNQDLNLAKTTGGAGDAFKQFDVQNQISNQQRNVDRLNQATQYNTNRDNSVSDQNIGQTNAERTAQRQRTLQQAQYNANLANMKAQTRTGQANNLTNSANATQAASQQTGSGLGAVAGFAGSKLLSSAASPSTPSTGSNGGYMNQNEFNKILHG